MRSRREEIAAMNELTERCRPHHLPSAPEFLESRYPGARAWLREVSKGPGKPRMPVVCLLFRGHLRQPDNVLGECTVCHDLVEHRPDAPTKTLLCIFCALDSTR